MEIKKAKFRKSEHAKLSPSFQLPGKGFVVQTWSWMSSLIIESKYRAYCPQRVSLTPKGDNAGLGKTAMVNTGTYLLLSQ